MAGRYAAALFDLADEAKAVDAVEADLRAINGMLAESEALRRFVRSPVLSRDDQAKGVAALAEAAKLAPLTAKFLGLVAKNRRLLALPAIIDAFLADLAARRGEIRAEVQSAVPLSPAHLVALKAALGKGGARSVAIDVKIDPAILGGLVIKVGSRMIDSSIKTKLDRLQQVMKGVA